MNDNERNDLQITISHALHDMKAEVGESFDINKVNLAELERRTGITRKRLRKLKEDGFVVKPHGLSGTKKAKTVLTGFTGIVDEHLKKGVTNSSVIKCLLTIKFDNKAARITIKFDNAWANNHFFLTSSFILDVKKDASAFRL